MAKYSYISFLFVLLLSFKGNSQVFPKTEINLDELIQKIVATQQEDANYEELYENLYQLYQNPIEINSATADELRGLYLLSEAQVTSFIAYRSTFGNFLSIYELQAVPLFDISTIRAISPFVELSSSLTSKDITGIFQRATDHYLLIRADQTLEPSKGFSEENYVGSPQRIYTRYRLQHPQDFSLGFISEKDAGEKNVFDYTVFHVQFQNKGKLKNLIVGDYQASFGQGLVFGAGYFAGKGGETIYTSRRSSVGLRPYNSVIEGGFYRGVAATYHLKKIELTTFASRVKRNASSNIQDNGYGPEEVFSSLLTSGLHRTETEIALKNTLSELDFGANLQYRFKSGRVGLSALYTQFDKTFERSTQLYNLYEFRGKSNQLVGIDFTKTWQNFNFYGEVARSTSGGIAVVGGWVASLSPKVEWAMNFRNYAKDFHSFYGIAFGEGTRVINEKGIYSGIKYTPKKGVVVSAFYDRFMFPWLRFQVDAPSTGFDYLLRFLYQPTKKWSFYTQFHDERKQKNLPNNESRTNLLATTERQSVLGNFDYSVSKKLRFQTRLQYNRFAYTNLTKSGGIALMQDIEGIVGKLQLKGRVAYYSTADYDSRIYAYENDVLYAVSFPAYYGEGLRLYLVSRYPLTRKLDVWVRVARTNRLDGVLIGSGNDALGLNHRTDTKIQLRYKL